MCLFNRTSVHKNVRFVDMLSVFTGYRNEIEFLVIAVNNSENESVAKSKNSHDITGCF
jgi:hypothetical protein